MDIAVVGGAGGGVVVVVAAVIAVLVVVVVVLIVVTVVVVVAVVFTRPKEASRESTLSLTSSVPKSSRLSLALRVRNETFSEHFPLPGEKVLCFRGVRKMSCSRKNRCSGVKMLAGSVSNIMFIVNKLL